MQQMQQHQEQQAYHHQQQQMQQSSYYQPQIPLPSPAIAGQIGSTSQNAATNSFYSSNPSPAVSVASLPQHDLSALASPLANPHQIPARHPMHQTLTLNGAALNSKKRKIAPSPTPFSTNPSPAMSNGVESISSHPTSNLGTIPRTPTPDELSLIMIHGGGGAGGTNGSAGINSTPGGSLTMDMNGLSESKLRTGGRTRTRGGQGGRG